MIDEDETKRRFGYYLDELAEHSGKKVVAICSGCGKIRELSKRRHRSLCKSCGIKGEKHYNFGKHLSEETRKKLSIAHKKLDKEARMRMSENRKGEKHPMFGKHHSAKTKKKISDALKGEKNPWFGKHHNDETRKKIGAANKGKHRTDDERAKIREARKHQKFPKCQTKPELIFEEMCKKYNLPFRYTGNSTFWIGKNPSVNPDFVECDGKKIAVEIFGDYWHSPLLNRKLPENRTLDYRKKLLKQYGWKLIVFWESDMKRIDAEAYVLGKLKVY